VLELLDLKRQRGRLRYIRRSRRKGLRLRGSPVRRGRGWCGELDCVLQQVGREGRSNAVLWWG